MFSTFLVISVKSRSVSHCCSCFGAVGGFETFCKLLSQALTCLKLGSSPRHWVKPGSCNQLKQLEGTFWAGKSFLRFGERTQGNRPVLVEALKKRCIGLVSSN